MSREPRPAPPDIAGMTQASALGPPLLRLKDLPDFLACHMRTIERLRAARRLPEPDLLIGTGSRKSPRWKVDTIRRWVDEGGMK